MAVLSIPYSTTEARTQLRSLLNEPTENFWTDTQLDELIQLGVSDVCIKANCFETSEDVTLVSGQVLYDLASSDIIKPVACYYSDTSETPDDVWGLQEIHPRQINHLAHNTAGPPYYWYWYAEGLNVWPPPTASENSDTVTIFYSKLSETITDIPDEFQTLAILWALSKAREKERKVAESQQIYSIYANSVIFHRELLIDSRNVDSKDMFHTPDNTVVV